MTRANFAPVSSARYALTLARFVLLEARRSGLLLIVLATMGAGIGLAAFMSEVAITEGANLQVAFLASFFRIVTVLLTATFVITSVVREASDKGNELLLSLPISRTTYYLGKLLGFSACGAVVAIAFAFFLLIWSAPASVAAWGFSLILESSLIAGVSLFFVMALGQVVAALAGVTAMYALGRVLAAIQSISASPLSGEESVLHTLARGGVDLVALLLPSLDQVTQSAWLLYAPPPLADYLNVLGMLTVYLALVIAAGLFDFHRRNL